MLLDLLADGADLDRFLVRNARRMGAIGWHVLLRTPCSAVVHRHHHRLLDDALLLDGEGGLVEGEEIVHGLARHDRLAESPVGLDDHLVQVLGDRIGAEEHAGAVRVDHQLHDRRDDAVLVRELLSKAGEGRPCGPQRRPALLDLFEHLVFADHVMVGVHHARERRDGRVLDGHR